MKIKAKIENIYMFGVGKISVGKSTNSLTDIPSITVAKLVSKEKIGDDLMNKQVEEKELILLSFKNIEGFKVFEQAVKAVKKHLKEQQKNE